MSPFSVTLPHVPDRELGPLLTHLAEAGYENPLIKAVTPRAASGKAPARGERKMVDLPDEWSLVATRDGQSYQWPEERDRYSRYDVFLGMTRAEGAVHIALGETIRKKRWGRNRKYVVAFLSSGSPLKPLVEFLATDDYETTHELVAVIRGSDGGRRMYGPGEELPEVYRERFRTQMYGERVNFPGVWNKVVAVAREDDHATILNHALIQSRRRQSR